MNEPDKKARNAIVVVALIFVGAVVALSPRNTTQSPSPTTIPAMTSAGTASVAPPAPEYVCELPQVWKEDDPISDIRKAALAEILRWAASGDIIKKGRCEINAKTDAQLEQDAKDAVEKAARDKVEAAKQAAAEEKRQREETLAEAKRQRAEAIAREKRDHEAAEQAKREAAQAARDHVKEIRDGINDGSIHVLSATDLSAQTHKWDGQKIITSLSCFYADAGEYRCVGGRMRIDFTSFEPDAAEEALKRNCDTISKSQRRSCMVKILFTYDGFDEMDIGGGIFGGKVTVVKSQSGSGEILTK
ncbi:MAG: hypothetical protein ACLPIC_16905 [Rhodoblastus sp.]|uniref:hypothetical protein n=1 Tax=Rhodoblastus sp. TaxID=1962975 RepID=UPI003F9BBF5F